MCITQDFENTAWHSDAPSFLFVQPTPKPLENYDPEDDPMGVDYDMGVDEDGFDFIDTKTPAFHVISTHETDAFPPHTGSDASTDGANQDRPDKHSLLGATPLDLEDSRVAEPTPPREDDPELEPVRIGAVRQGKYYLIDTSTPLFVSTDRISTSTSHAFQESIFDSDACANQGIIDRYSLREELPYDPETYHMRGDLFEWYDMWRGELVAERFGDVCMPEWDYERLKADRVIFSWRSLDHRPPRCVGENALITTFLKIFLFRLRSCSSSRCTARREFFDKAAPPCEWRAFREAVLTALACWMPKFFWVLMIDLMSDPNDVVAPCLDLHGLLYLVRWARRFIFGTPIGETMSTITSVFDVSVLHRILAPGFESKAMDLSRSCRVYGICPNRLWNLSTQSVLGTGDIPHIAEIALKTPGLRRLEGQDESHTACTEQSCLHSDVNNTSVEQAHKSPCSGSRSCQDITFPTSALDRAFERGARGLAGNDTWQPTAWRIRDETPSHGHGNQKSILPSLCHPENLNYIAISHVWSDGTGAGVKAPGLVNQCLVEYFYRVAEHLGCDGLWWDTVCIPRERKARSIAVDTMLTNYENAKCTVIHDQSLVDFEWKEDGSPAVALILSAWFSRGWTAAELFASRNHDVKVIFKNPDARGPPLLKDLDSEILAWDYQTDNNRGSQIESFGVPKLGHYIVTDIIRQFRAGMFDDRRSIHGGRRPSANTNRDPDRLKKILRIMRCRTTSWARDRMLIPGLICLPPEVSISTSTGSAITSKLLEHLRTIAFDDLLHTTVPVRQFGPWSWCPSSIYDMGLFSVATRHGTDSTHMRVGSPGTLSSKGLKAYSLLESDQIIPAGSHPSIRARVLEALSKRSHCMLLTDRSWSSDGRLCILCMPIVPGHASEINYFKPRSKDLEVHCRWIACVYVSSPSDPSPRVGSGAALGNSEQQVQRLLLPADSTFVFGHEDFPDRKTVEFQYLVCAFSVPTVPPVTSTSIITVKREWYRNYIVWLSTNAEQAGPVAKHESEGSIRPSRRSHAWVPLAIQMQLSAGKGADGRPGSNHNSDAQNLNTDDIQTSMIIDLRTPENKVALSVIPSAGPIRNAIRSCDASHQFRCGGVIQLSWELLGAMGEEIQVDNPVLLSMFHLVSQVVSRGYSTGVSIGQESFMRHLAPMSRKVFSLDLFKRGPQPPTRVGLLLTSAAHNSTRLWQTWLQHGGWVPGWGGGVPQVLQEGSLPFQTIREFSQEEVDKNEFVGMSEEEVSSEVSRPSSAFG